MRFIRVSTGLRSDEMAIIPVDAIGHLSQDRPGQCVIHTLGGKVYTVHDGEEVARMIHNATDGGFRPATMWDRVSLVPAVTPIVSPPTHFTWSELGTYRGPVTTVHGFGGATVPHPSDVADALAMKARYESNPEAP